MKKRYVYFFGGKKSEGNSGMKDLLGGKGANLAEMNSAGLPVPPGFTITTEACRQYYIGKGRWPEGLAGEVERNLRKLERLTGKKLGGSRNPLLVSVRSGAAVSMPGMMDTVLNLGLNPDSMTALMKLTGNPRFVWDAYRRFIQMFGDVVMGVPHHEFEHALDRVKSKRGAKQDTDLSAGDLQEVVAAYKKIYKKHTREDFPNDPTVQLKRSIDAVFGSWNNPRAVKYRQINDIKGLLGTAINVQAMVFGNLGKDSGTGVAFTRNPATGENRFYGEYLMNAQGEDVVAGIRTPRAISTLSRVDARSYRELLGIRKKLERIYRDMQDLEFTIEKGKLYILQTRGGKRTAAAAVKIAVDMAKEGMISREEAIMRVDPGSLDQLLHPVFVEAAEKKADRLAVGLPASPGAATGQVVFSADEAEAWAEDGKTVILCRIETSPEDIGGMNVARGILTARGGMTSHAAVVARGMGTCCVAGCGDIRIDYRARKFTVNGKTVKEGDWISLNGSTGAVYAGKVETVEPMLTGPFGIIMKLADKYRRLGVRANSDTPHDTEVAVRFGAEGIGLTRTEHMFFEGDRIVSFRRLILVAEEVKNLRRELASAEGEKKKELQKKLRAPLSQYNRAIKELLPLQRRDFEGIFEALKGRPCTIRLLDPPLHEFLPHDAAGQKEMAEALEVKPAEIRAIVSSLHEANPMLGHRGCRLGLTYPEVSDMQVRAIIEAAINVKRKKKIPVRPEIMIPLVGHAEELRIARDRAEAEIARVFKERRVRKGFLRYTIGTMIEVPRAAVTADEVARYADFFSFGTNDLTQMGCGFSRDDAGKFLGDYVRMGIYEYDPFQVLDQDGIGRLVEMAVKLGRRTKPDLKIGICGEHGGEPRSVEFCHRVGLNYVSCSPYRIPIARLAAAQAAIKEGRNQP
ncbi:MAG: pyruvate, phosphate dikinase [Candidatus Tritonobacter lacicola]|nr:pyruvate, phosphate dikinase [Candidatus Tritonobacter lacicola]